MIVQVISEFGSDYDFIRFGVGYALTISDLNTQDEVSEMWVGKRAGIRDQLFISSVHLFRTGSHVYEE